MIELEVEQQSEQRAQLLAKKNAEILEMIATGKPAPSIYDAIALMYEARNPGMRCSLLELKGNKLMHGGAPSLPTEYCEAVNGLENGPSVGSCGTSTYTGVRVLVENIETDPKWENIKHFALPHGMRCCWSEPIINSKGKVLGAFGMYYDYPALPNEEKLADLESAGRLASIVMDRDQREERLRQSEFKYRTLVENLPQRFFLKDKHSNFVSCSKNLANDLGITPDQFVGKTDHDYLPKEEADNYHQQDTRIMRTGVTEETEHSVFVNAEEKTIHMVKAPAMDEEGNIDGVLGILWDITEQKNLEARYFQAQKMESMGTLVGGVAHEFNNTLAGITGRLYLAKSEAANNSKALRHLDIISKLSFRAAHVIKQLLTFSRKSTITMTVFDLSVFIKETYQLHTLGIPKNIKLEARFCDATLPVEGDESIIQQVLLNLLSNARDAVSNRNNPRINLSLERYAVDELFSHSHPELEVQDYAHLIVEDNGCGIPEESKNKIFDPFYTTKEGGTGLGLALVYGAVQAHKGVVEVETSIRDVTRIHIYLPLSSSTLQKESSQTKQQELGVGETILFVDDETELRELGKEVLESLGYSVLEAANGSEAIEIYKDNKDLISLVILDVVMPEVGGVATAESIKAINEDAKIIFCTGYDGYDTLDENLLAWAEVIDKPYDIDEFSRLINKMLSS